jgi:hypothetical protein
MLDLLQLGTLPATTTLQRNGRTATANRVSLGDLELMDQTITVADSDWVNDVPPLPVRVTNGVFPVYAYQWNHQGRSINICLVVRFRRPFLAKPKQLRVETNIRPDLADGVIVDSGEVTIKSKSRISVPSGLGDGYYPVYALTNMLGSIHAVVIDFKLWHVPRYFLMPNQAQDEYGFVYFTDRGDAAAR